MTYKMTYKIVDAETFEELEVLVNQMLNDGWELQGGISLALDYGANVCQAMVKDEMTYKIVREETYGELKVLVNQMIEDGWVKHGEPRESDIREVCQEIKKLES
jgi:hypothetical protein